jgi:hypothetical protein
MNYNMRLCAPKRLGGESPSYLACHAYSSRDQTVRFAYVTSKYSVKSVSESRSVMVCKSEFAHLP